MIGQKFWIYAASLSLSLTVWAGETAPNLREQRTGAPNIIANKFSTEENGDVIVAIDARIETPHIFLSAQTIRRNIRTGLIIAEGGIVYTTPELRILGSRIQIDPRSDSIEAWNVRFGKSPIYFSADSLQIVKGDKIVSGVRAWNGEPDLHGMHLKVSKLSYNDKSDWLSLQSATAYVAGIPFLSLPYYGQKGLDFPYDIWINSGNEDKQGAFLRSTILTKVTPSLWAGGLVDLYSRSGILVGPSFRLDNTHLRQNGTIWKGDLQSGWINDQAAPIADIYGRLPDNQRVFLIGNLKGISSDGVELTANAFAQSDPDVLRDFRPFLIGSNGNPQINIEAVKTYQGGYLSASITAKADNYQDIVQKLPELRWDLPTTLLEDSEWTQRAFVSLGYFTERPSEALPLASFQAATLASQVWSTARLDTYYGLSQTLHAGDWLSFRPVAGVRITGWSDSLVGQRATSKIVGQAGFDLEGLITGSWAWNSDKWEINGLRHSIRPLLQYRAMPGAEKSIGLTPQTQRAVSVNVLEEIDLADRLDSASTTDRQAIRFGFRNALETRDTETGTRELLRANLFADWRQGPTEADTGRSDLLGSLQFTPTHWLTFTSSIRLPNGGGAPQESLQSLTIKSGDFWQNSLYWAELRQVTPARQLVWEGRLWLNSIYSLIGGVNYDAILGQTTFISTGLVQRIGNSWEIEYGVNKRLDPLNRGIGSFGFHLRMRLFRF